MKLQITARGFHASPQLHRNLGEDLERLARFNDSILGAHVILEAGRKSGRHRAEGIVKIRDKSVCAHAEADAMGKAIEAMMGKVERQLKKENEKLKIHKTAPRPAVAGR